MGDPLLSLCGIVVPPELELGMGGVPLREAPPPLPRDEELDPARLNVGAGLTTGSGGGAQNLSLYSHHQRSMRFRTLICWIASSRFFSKAAR
jgi:hypothetical protein